MVKFWFNRIYKLHKACIEECPLRYREDVLKMAGEEGMV